MFQLHYLQTKPAWNGAKKTHEGLSPINRYGSEQVLNLRTLHQTQSIPLLPSWRRNCSWEKEKKLCELEAAQCGGNRPCAVGVGVVWQCPNTRYLGRTCDLCG